MKLKLLLLTFFLIITTQSFSEDYQYQYFNQGKKHVPFSDYIPRIRLHYQTVPHYLEDYYELYGMKMYYNENSLRKNIERMKTALNCKFRHPSMALVKIDSEEEYLKYRNIMFMHINLLIMRNHMRIAARYDKMKINFYSGPFAEDISKSLDIAEDYYRKSIPFWEKAVEYAGRASKIKITTDLGFMESERYSIIHNELDYGKIINGHIKKVAVKKGELKKLSAMRK